MSNHRHDSLTSRLGERTNRSLWRLWIEDNGFRRLARNGFAPGTPINPVRRPGVGLVINASVLGSCHVSSRRSEALLSYEAKDLGNFLAPDVRIRISVGQIIVTPMLRIHSVARPQTEVWTIEGLNLITPSGQTSIQTSKPLNLRHDAELIIANLTEGNLIYATEVIGNQRPGRVQIAGEALLMTIASQFLVAAGYSPTGAEGCFAR